MVGFEKKKIGLGEHGLGLRSIYLFIACMRAGDGIDLDFSCIESYLYSPTALIKPGIMIHERTNEYIAYVNRDPDQTQGFFSSFFPPPSARYI